MAREVSIVVKAYNQTKAAFSSIGRGIRDLTRGDFGKGFGKIGAGIQQMAKMGGAALAGLGRMAGMAASAAAAAGVVVIAVAKKALDAYKTQVASEERLAQVLKNTGYAAGYTSSELKKMASELQPITGVGDEATLSVMSLIAASGKVRGDSFKRATVAALDMAAAMKRTGADQAEVEGAAQSLAIALQDPAEGLSRLTRQGIKFTKAKEDEIKALADAGKLNEAQVMILDAVEERYKGVAAAAHSQTKAQDDLKNNFGDLMEQIGQAINESDGFKSIMQSLADVVKNLSESGYIELWAQRISEAMAVVARVVTPIIGLFQKVAGAVQAGAAFAGGFVGAQGGIGDRIAAGREAAAQSGTEYATAIAAIKAARAKREEEKAAEEQKAKAEAERLAAEEAKARLAAEAEAERLAAEEAKAAALKQSQDEFDKKLKAYEEELRLEERALQLEKARADQAKEIADLQGEIADKQNEISKANALDALAQALEQANKQFDVAKDQLEARMAMGVIGSPEQKAALKKERDRARLGKLLESVGISGDVSGMSDQQAGEAGRRAKILKRLGITMGGAEVPFELGAEGVSAIAAKKGLKLSKADQEAFRRGLMEANMKAEKERILKLEAAMKERREQENADNLRSSAASLKEMQKKLDMLLQAAPG